MCFSVARRSIFPLAKQLIGRVNNLRKFSDKCAQRLEQISQLLGRQGVNSKEALQFIQSKKELSKINDSTLLKKVKILTKKNVIQIEDDKRHPRIASKLTEHYLCLHELGLKNITVSQVFKYYEIIQEKVSSLSRDPADFLAKQIDMPSNFRRTLSENYPDLANQTIHFLQGVVLIEYLVWKLNINHADAVAVAKKHLAVGERSLTTLRRIISLLIDDIGFPYNKIQKNGFLLNVCETNAQEILGFETIGGKPVREHIVKHPRLLSIRVENIKEVEHCLDKFNITADQISKCGNIYCLRAAKVCERLRLLVDIPEIASMKTSSRYLNLVYYFDKVLRRLDEVKSLNMYDILSVDLLTTSERYYSKRLRLARCKRNRQELIMSLATKLNVSPKKLVVPKHELFASMKSCDLCTLDYLLQNFDRHEVIANLPLVVFDLETVKRMIGIVELESATKVNILSDVLQRLESVVCERKSLQESDSSSVENDDISK